MNKLILLLLFVLSTVSYANCIDGNEIKIPKDYKTETTFSGDLQNDKSFHLIFAKDKKKKTYTVFSYLFDGTNIEKLPNLISDKSYSILSFHQSNDILTLLVTYKVKKKSFLKKIDYNTFNKTKTESEPIIHDDFLTSIRKQNRSILLYKSDDKLQISDYKNSDNAIQHEYQFNSKKDDVFNFFKNKSVTTIKTDEYVPNGAVNDVRLYFEDNQLTFTRDSDEPLNINIGGIVLNNKKTNTTEVLRFHLNDKILIPKIGVYKNQENIKFKKATSYIFGNKLFQLGLSKNNGFVKISNIKENSTLNSFALNDELSKFIKGNKDFEGIEKYLKTAGKNKYNATVTVNKTKSDKLRLRVDYVDITYSYNYNWWWHHHQLMWHMQQHQIMIQQATRNIPTGFGPRVACEDAFLNATVSKEKRYFELLIDIKGQLINEDLPDLLFKNIDKKAHINELEEITNYLYESSCFLDNSFRYIAFDKKTKSFFIKTKSLE
jgi:hypothetical protein